MKNLRGLVRLSIVVVTIWLIWLAIARYVWPSMPGVLRSNILWAISILVAIVAFLGGVAEAQGLFETERSTKAKGNDKKIRNARRNYFEYLEKYKYIELTAMPVFDWGVNQRYAAIKDIFIEPNLKPVNPKVSESPYSIWDAIQNNRRIVILGDAGSGKTTLLQYVVSDLITKRGRLTKEFFPIFIPLRDYVYKGYYQKGSSFLEYLYGITSNAEVMLPPGFFEYHLEQGKCIVLFDAFDEIFEPEIRQQVRERIDGFPIGYHRSNRVIVTSRIADYDKAPLNPQYEPFILSDLTPHQIRLFIEKWYQLKKHPGKFALEKTDSFIASLSEVGVAHLSLNPFHLTSLILIHQREGGLPNRRIDLYDELTKIVLMRDKWRGISSEKWDLDEKRYRLEYVAHWMHTNNRNGYYQPVLEIEQTKLNEVLASYLVERERIELSLAQDEAMNFTKWVADRTELIVINNGIAAFKYRTLQEYFVACRIHWEHTNTLSLQKLEEVFQLEYRHNPHWQEVILLLLGKLPEQLCDSLVGEFLEITSEFNDIYPRDWILAAHCLAEDIRLSFQIRNMILDKLFELWLNPNSWNPHPVSGAWRDFHRDLQLIFPRMRGSKSQEEIIARTLSVAKHEDNAKQVGAIKILGYIGVSRQDVVDTLWSAIRHGVPPVQDSARQSLSQLAYQDQAVLAEVYRVANNAKESLRVRGHASRILLDTKHYYPLTLNIALQKLTECNDKRIFRTWINQITVESNRQLLLRQEKQQIERILVETIKVATKPVVKALSIQAISELRLCSRETINSLIAVSRDENPWLREQAYWALGDLGHSAKQVIRVLENGLNDEDGRTRKAARNTAQKLQNHTAWHKVKCTVLTATWKVKI